MRGGRPTHRGHSGCCWPELWLPLACGRSAPSARDQISEREGGGGGRVWGGRVSGGRVWGGCQEGGCQEGGCGEVGCGEGGCQGKGVGRKGMSYHTVCSIRVKKENKLRSYTRLVTRVVCPLAF